MRSMDVDVYLVETNTVHGPVAHWSRLGHARGSARA